MKDFLNARRRRPTHPGEALREDIMPGAGINQAQLAKALGVSRLTISEIVLEERAVTPQAKFLFDERRYRLVNFVGRFENLDEDFAKVCDKLGLGPQSLPHENAARARRPYRDYYNAQTRALVETLYREDIERFGFTF